MSEPTNRPAQWVRWLSVLAIVVALFLLVRALPVETAVDKLERWVGGLGVVGPIVFGLSYVVAALLFVPGAALTIAAGAVFGLLGGTLTVSLASTTAAALAFLIARYLARDKVQALARKQPQFDAIDRAVGEGGWKIVAMLRLVPLFPFSAGNYLFGLTSVRFWPCVLASWVFMLPGTFLYVYIGYLGIESVQAASGDVASVGFGRWVLLGVGLAAAVAVTIYLTRLAKRALAERTELDEQQIAGPEAHATSSAGAAAAVAARAARGGWTVGTIVLVVAAALSFGGAVWARVNKDRFAGLFGPPVVRSAETYEGTESDASFDHTAFDELLEAHVDDAGQVGYAALARDSQKLDGYLERLASAPFAALGRDQKLALLINAYNAFTLRLILDHRPVESIRKIPDAWDEVRWNLGGRVLSLNQIEHREIRENFVEPRIHFALVCAAVGCPKLRDEAYTAQRLEEQLRDQTRYVHSHDRWFRFDPERGVVHLTRLYDWYGGDFEKVAGSVLDYVGQHVPAVAEARSAGRDLRIEWLPYDWSLNDARSKGAAK